MLDYKSGIHKDSGKTFEVFNDFILTPFWTEQFCKELVDIAKFYDDRFVTDTHTSDLHFWKINNFLFRDFASHYKRDILPILNKEFLNFELDGLWSPFIVKHDIGKSTPLHQDRSKISMSIKLNNDYVGGEIQFPRQKFSNKDIPIGNVLLWAGEVTHPHLITEVKSGTKYTVVGFTFPPAWSSSPVDSLLFTNII